MRREAERTLFSLFPWYQRGVRADDYEVIAIDNGSTEPLNGGDVQAAAPHVRYLSYQTASRSPVEAVNLGVELAGGENVAICIDGARILSPRILRYSLMACRAFARPFVCTLGWHLGDEVQNIRSERATARRLSIGFWSRWIGEPTVTRCFPYQRWRHPARTAGSPPLLRAIASRSPSRSFCDWAAFATAFSSREEGWSTSISLRQPAHHTSNRWFCWEKKRSISSMVVLPPM